MLEKGIAPASSTVYGRTSRSAALEVESETRRREGVEDQVRRAHQERRGDGDREQPRIPERIGEALAGEVEEGARARPQVPAVEPDEAADVDPDAAEHERRRGGDPPGHRTRLPPADPLAPLPAPRRTTLCTRYSDPSPSSIPVTANDVMISPSNQYGDSGSRSRCTKSVTMDGAVGKNASHRAPSTTSAGLRAPRRCPS